MFKGIQTTIFLGTLLLSHSALADKTGQWLQACVNISGKPAKETIVSGPTKVGETDTEIIMETCYKYECADSTGNSGEFDFDDPNKSFSELDADEIDRSGGGFAKKNNECKKVPVPKQKNPYQVGADRAGISAKYNLKFNGKIFSCNEGESYKDCLKRHGHGSLGIAFSSDGIGKDGLELILAFQKPQVDARADVAGAGAGQVGKLCAEIDECAWYNPFCSNDELVYKQCIGAGVGTSAGLDYVIGADVDLGRVSRGDRVGRGFYVQYNGRDYLCAAGEDRSRCLARLRASGQISGGTSAHDCATCGGGWAAYASAQGNSLQGVLSGVGSLLAGAGQIAAPWFAYRGVKAQASAYRAGEEARWNGLVGIAEQCQIQNTNYNDSSYAFMSSNETHSTTLSRPECNGFNTGEFANNQGWGRNSFGSFGNRWGSAGFSNSFQAAMYGPNGRYYMGNTSGLSFDPRMGLDFSGNLNLANLLGIPNISINSGGDWRTPGFNPNSRLSWDANISSPWASNRWSASSNGLVPWRNNSSSYWDPRGGLNVNGGLDWRFNGGGDWRSGGDWRNGGRDWRNGGRDWRNGGRDWRNNGGNRNRYAIEDSFRSNMDASSQGSYFQRMALEREANNSFNDLNYSGYDPRYSPMNMGGSLNAQFGVNFR